jgi:hypothetical protein
MTTDIVQYRRDFLLRKLLNQPEQLLTLRAHGFSVRTGICAAPLSHGVPVACPIGR